MQTNPDQLKKPSYDILIRNGILYDGRGGEPFKGNIAIHGDKIVAAGDTGAARGQVEIDAHGLAVAPGFINMLSWACESLLADGRSQSDIRQGVTLEVMGEGFSYGPLNEAMRQEMLRQQGDFKFDIPWNTLDEYLKHLVKSKVSTNVTSFVGTSTLRTFVMGYENRPATPQELDQICNLARQALDEGAVGIAAALAYVPDSFYTTAELTALARVAAEYDALFIAHMRGEGNHLLEGIDEMIEIARQSGARTEIYHLKVAGWRNWDKLEAAIQKIEAARASGLQITADMYPYAASASGLDLCMPGWVQEGGHQAWLERLKDPAIRQRLYRELSVPADDWENALLEVQSPEQILFAGFKNPALKHLVGKTLAEVSAQRGTSPEDTVMDLIIEDDSRVSTVYFTMLEDNLRKQFALPWVSLCSDARSMAPEGIFLKDSTHPRAYGSFARFLGKYVRDERLIPLAEAVRRLTSLPAANLHLDRRGALQASYFADVVIFDPATIQDHATYTQPQQYATGVAHVFVNGVQVLKDGEHTGATPGRVVRRCRQSTTHPLIRNITNADIHVADQILAVAFTNKESRANDLRRYLEIQPDGWFMAELEGQPTGMVGVTDYGPYAYIGMMAVLPEAQGKGIGRALMEHALAWLDRRGAPIVLLDASKKGFPLYASLGFVEEDLANVYQLLDYTPTPYLSNEVSTLGLEDLQALCEFDTPIFGADRSAIFRALLRDYPGRALAMRDPQGKISGYLFAHPQRLGPWVAKQPQDAEKLLRAALALPYEGRPLAISPQANQQARALLERFGFQCVRFCRHMRLGGSCNPCQRALVYGQTSLSAG